MRNRPFEIVLAPLLAAALLALAGVAVAVDEEVGEVYVLTDKKTDRTRARLDLAGSSFQAVVSAECQAFVGSSNSSLVGSLLEVESEHPDRVGIAKKHGKVAQSQKENLPTVRIETGSGAGKTTNYLECQRASVEADVKTNKTPAHGSFEASGKDCACSDGLGSDDCSLLAEQVNLLLTGCLDNSSLDLSFKDGAVKRFKIKGRGEAFPASEVPELPVP